MTIKKTSLGRYYIRLSLAAGSAGINSDLEDGAGNKQKKICFCNGWNIMLKKEITRRGWAQSLKDLLLISGFISFLKCDLAAIT